MLYGYCKYIYLVSFRTNLHYPLKKKQVIGNVLIIVNKKTV